MSIRVKESIAHACVNKDLQNCLAMMHTSYHIRQQLTLKMFPLE